MCELYADSTMVCLAQKKKRDFSRGRNLDMACNESEEIANKSRALETRNGLINVRNSIVNSNCRDLAQTVFSSIEVITSKRN